MRAALVATLLSTSGCIAVGTGLASLSQPEFEDALGWWILRPDLSCETLASQFLVDYLPIVDTPDQAGIEYQEHWVVADDGSLLRIWYLPAKLDRGTVVFAEGSGGAMPCYLFHTRLLVHNGWNVVMFDYRGFGESTGSPALDHLIPDLNAVIDWTHDYLGASRMTLYGISLGSIPVVAAAAERPALVRGVILDSPLALGETIRRFRGLLQGATEDVVAILPPEMLSEVMIEQVSEPLLVFLNEADELTSPESVQLIFDRALGAKTLVRMPGLPHAWGAFWENDVYTREVERFLSRVWGQQIPLGEPDAAALP